MVKKSGLTIINVMQPELDANLHMRVFQQKIKFLCLRGGSSQSSHTGHNLWDRTIEDDRITSPGN